MSIETKLSAARTKLILDKPFLGALVLRLPLKEADPKWCTTTATDAKHFYYNAEYIEALEPVHLQFVLAHEALHCALSHFARRQHRDLKRWDVACDLAVNSLLVNDGFMPPPGALHDMGFDGLTAEEIYPFIHDEFDEPMDKHIYDDIQKEQGKSKQGKGGDAPDGQSQQPQESHVGVSRNSEADRKDQGGLAEQPQPLTPDERETLNTQWQQRLAGAAQIAQQAGKMGGAMARLIDHLLQPQLPWRNLLAHHVSSIARDDYNYSRPSTRRGDPVVYPSLRSSQINVTVILDTSGSIKDDDFQEFLTEMDAIKSQMRARIVLHACDTELVGDGPWIFEPWDEIVVAGKSRGSGDDSELCEKVTLPIKFSGGGGTSFQPPFQWIETQDLAPDMLIYFTDAKGEFPVSEPGFPVLWLVKGKEPVPWGTRIQLN